MIEEIERLGGVDAFKEVLRNGQRVPGDGGSRITKADAMYRTATRSRGQGLRTAQELCAAVQETQRT